MTEVEGGPQGRQADSVSRSRLVAASRQKPSLRSAESRPCGPICGRLRLSLIPWRENQAANKALHLMVALRAPTGEGRSVR
jgi:hypothetical protein